MEWYSKQRTLNHCPSSLHWVTSSYIALKYSCTFLWSFYDRYSRVTLPSRVWFESRLNSFERCLVWCSNIFWFSLHSTILILWWLCSPWRNQSSFEWCLCFLFYIQSMPQWVWVDRCRCWSLNLPIILWTLPSSTLLF